MSTTNQTSPIDPRPAERLGQRLMPGPFETLPLCLLVGVILFAAWSGSTWVLACLAALGVMALIAAVVAGVAGRSYRPQRGAIVHQRFGFSRSLGWGTGATILAALVVFFWLPLFLDLRAQSLWVRVGVAIALVVVGWICAQFLLRARARLAGSPEGALSETLTSSSGASFADPLDLAIADLLSRTQMMRVDALAEDLVTPGDEVCARVEDLIARSLVDRERNDDGPVDDHHWVHLTFHGEQQLAAALQNAPADA